MVAFLGKKYYSLDRENLIIPKKVVLYFINMIVMWRGIYRGKVERHTFYENIKNLSTFLELGMYNSCSSKYIMVSDSPSRQNDVLEKPWFD